MKKWVVVLLVLLVTVSIGASKKDPVVKIKDGTITLDQLGKTLPGMGTIMIEVGNRFTAANYAYKAGNWDVVGYQLKELGEIMEVGEITRPKRKKAIKKFLSGSAYKKLNAAVKNKNAAEFQAALNETITACNKCHTSGGVPFIQYNVPTSYSSNLKLAP